MVTLGGPPAPGSTAADSSANANATPQPPDDDAINKAIAEREEEMFKDAEKELTDAIQNTPDLKAFADNLIIDRTPEGMRIQIVDQERRSMFPSGSAEPYPRTKQILQLVAKIIMKLPNRISIAGHTDSQPFANRAELYQLGALQRPRQCQPPRAARSRRRRHTYRRSQRHRRYRAAVPGRSRRSRQIAASRLRSA